jgi:hypothetical protein
MLGAYTGVSSRVVHHGCRWQLDRDGPGPPARQPTPASSIITWDVSPFVDALCHSAASCTIPVPGHCASDLHGAAVAWPV